MENHKKKADKERKSFSTNIDNDNNNNLITTALIIIIIMIIIIIIAITIIMVIIIFRMTKRVEKMKSEISERIKDNQKICKQKQKHID